MGKKLRNFIIKIDNKMKIMAIKYKYILIMVINWFLQGSKYDYWLLDQATSVKTNQTAPGNDGEFVSEGRAL